ncbi:MarR family transcriptional regulator [Actinomadura barringtoniae]|uniref:MarR family transcriptional regulator n=1 Tax=Actinomadura barringtoniae TaxID=1427535 RepID=A0A939T4L7_9ACTN|nr:MarR family transcriptional regulator [Actinomadura barringtoniae]MBO2446062.1 MarR family transcriptional regulator [Actinomadura barringtoniae]
MTARGDREELVPGELLDGLVQTSFTVMAVLTQVGAAHDLSLTQLRVLAILRDHRPKIAELAAHLGLERSSVSGLIDRSVRRGLVLREASSEDARAVRLSLTDKGRRLAVEVAAEVADRIRPTTDRLGRAEQRRLSVLLNGLLN